MKKILVPAFVLVLLLASITPAVAGRGDSQRVGVSIDGNFDRKNGKITDIGDDWFTIQVTSGNQKGQDITVQVTTSTIYRYKVTGEGDCMQIGFDDLKEGQKVGVTGTFNGDFLYAKVVVVQVDASN